MNKVSIYITQTKHARFFLLFVNNDCRIFSPKKPAHGWKDEILVLYSQSQRGEHEKQIFFDTMYTS